MDFRVPFEGPVGHWLCVFANVFGDPFWGALPTSILERRAMILGVICVCLLVCLGETVFPLRRRERIACRALQKSSLFAPLWSVF